jgi:hypothetical protein
MPARRPAARTVLLLGVAAAVAVVVVALFAWPRLSVDGPTPRAAARPSVGSSAGPMRVAAGSTLARRPQCDHVRHRFRPTTISVPGVTGGAAVITPPRDANDIPGTPPISGAGKVLFAMDLAQGVLPGDPAGNVLLNAHTWPDGTALGNHLLAGLHRGDRIVVHGGTSRLCYRVTERVQVLAVDGLPRYYDKHGPPRLAILVCSGRRLGPGDWTHRTVWFASPAA